MISCTKCNVKMKLSVIPSYEYEEGYTLDNVKAHQCPKCNKVFFTEEQAHEMEIRTKEVKEKKLEIALEKFRNNEATASKAARMAGIPLSQFLDILVQKGIDFHYGIKELKEDFEGFV